MAVTAHSCISSFDAMNSARFFTVFVVVVMGIYGLAGFYFLPLANFEGDLTRMAMLPDVYFERTRAQPVINAELMKSAEWKDADVLAIGDSFTDARIWQTVFAQHGIRVRTERWGTVYNLCEDISVWIRKQGFKGKYIIIESAEKYFEGRIDRSVACKRTSYHPLAVIHRIPPEPLPDNETMKYSGSLSVGIQTAINRYKYDQLTSKPEFKRWDMQNEVRLERIENGCELFSHPHCNNVLFYDKDRLEDMGANVFANMETITARLQGYTTVWAIIPDKATVYLKADKKFWDESEHRFHTPNILKEFRQAVNEKTVDLYLANNTHVSTTGYLLLGKILYKNIYP